MSIRVTPLHLVGSVVLPFLGTGTTWPLFHSSKSAWLCQNWLQNIRIQERFSLSSYLNELGGTPFSTGALSFANFVMDFFISSHEMSWYSSSITSIVLILSHKGQSIGLWLLKTLWKCRPNTEAFYASVVARSPLGSYICMTVGKAWWLVSTLDRTRKLSHAS